jgi:hypothetical protein
MFSVIFSAYLVAAMPTSPILPVPDNDELSALADIFKANKLQAPTFSGWCYQSEEATFECENGKVTYLGISEKSVSAIPDSIAKLTALKSL